MADFYQNKDNVSDVDFVENQYLIIKDESGNIVDKYVYHDGKLEDVKFKKISSQMLGDIKPRNIKQQCYFDLLNNDNIPVKLVVGNAGTGKSFVASNYIVEKLNSAKFDRFILIRNNVNVRGVHDIGFRKGDTNQKLDGFVSFLKDIITPENFDQLVYENRLETPYIGELRGRSFSKCCVYVSESQNLNIDLVKMIVSRIGENSILILDGDLNQCDANIFSGENNGLEAISRSLKGNKMFGVIELDKVERSAIASLAELIK